MRKLAFCVLAVAVTLGAGCNGEKLVPDGNGSTVSGATAKPSAASKPVAAEEDVSDPDVSDMDYSEEYHTCIGGPDAGVSSDLDRMKCADEELIKQDEKLNRAYRELLSTLTPAEKSKVRGLQRAWIKRRDSSCASEEMEFKGTLDRLLESQCVLRHTADRVMWLKRYS